MQETLIREEIGLEMEQEEREAQVSQEVQKNRWKEDNERRGKKQGEGYTKMKKVRKKEGNEENHVMGREHSDGEGKLKEMMMIYKEKGDADGGWGGCKKDNDVAVTFLQLYFMALP